MHYIKGFDGLRAISILLVLLTHLGLYNQLPDTSFLKTHYNLISGTTGVMIFLLLVDFLSLCCCCMRKEILAQLILSGFLLDDF
jgi:hypothetical protein